MHRSCELSQSRAILSLSNDNNFNSIRENIPSMTQAGNPSTCTSGTGLPWVEHGYLYQYLAKLTTQSIFFSVAHLAHPPPPGSTGWLLDVRNQIFLGYLGQPPPPWVRAQHFRPPLCCPGLPVTSSLSQHCKSQQM